MPRITKPLTHTEVSQAKPKDKINDLSDGGGLQLRIKPNGSKIWQLNYFRPYTKKRTSISFGPYPAVTLADARSKKKEARALPGSRLRIAPRVVPLARLSAWPSRTAMHSAK